MMKNKLSRWIKSVTINPKTGGMEYEYFIPKDLEEKKLYGLNLTKKCRIRLSMLFPMNMMKNRKFKRLVIV